MFEISKSFDIHYIQVLWNTNGLHFCFVRFFLGCCYLLKLDDDYEKYDIYILVMYAVCSIKCVSEIYTYLYNRNDLGVEMIMESPLSPDHMMPLQLCWLSIMHECIETV